MAGPWVNTLLLLTATALLLPSPRCCCVYAISDSDKRMLMLLHLSVRVSVQPSAMDMNILEWSDQLEAHARYWVEKCSWKYPDLASRRERQLALLGLNIAAMATPEYDDENSPPNTAELYKLWLRAQKYYDYDLNVCKEGYCGHYLQLIWASTDRVGCERAYCKGAKGVLGKVGKGRHVLVCVYSPPGRFANEKPYKRLESGDDFPLDPEPWILDTKDLEEVAAHLCTDCRVTVLMVCLVYLVLY